MEEYRDSVQVCWIFYLFFYIYFLTSLLLFLYVLYLRHSSDFCYVLSSLDLILSHLFCLFVIQQAGFGKVVFILLADNPHNLR